MILNYQDFKPKIAEGVFIAPDAYVIGDVEIENDVSIFFGAVLRGDILPIKIGARSNIQEHSVLHTSRGKTPTIIESQVTLGHRSMVHSAHVKSQSLIGMGAIVLDEAVVGEQCIIGAGALVTQNKIIPPRSLVIGSPAKVIRPLSDNEIENLQKINDKYVETGKIYIEAFK